MPKRVLARYELPDLLQRLAPVAYPALRESYIANCCVAGAVILTRVFAEYGYKAETVPVSMLVCNAAMMKLLSHGPLPKDKDRREMLFDISGAWSVGAMPSSAQGFAINNYQRGGYSGHLLLKVDNYLIDPTIQQTELPPKGIILPPMVVTNCTEEFLAGEKLILSIGDGTVVMYQRINDQSYLKAPDWKNRTTPFPETVRKILNRLEAA